MSEIDLNKPHYAKQIVDALEFHNSESSLARVVEKNVNDLTSQFSEHCKSSDKMFEAIVEENAKTSESLEYIKKNMATMPEVKEYVDQHYKLKKLKAYEDGEISSVFHIQHDTPMAGNVAVKNDDDAKALTRKAVIIATSITTGIAAAILILQKVL